MSTNPHERLQEGVMSVRSASPILKDGPYDSGSFLRPPMIPEAAHNQVVLLANTSTGTAVVIGEDSEISAKEIRKKKPDREVIVSLQAMPISFQMNLRTSNYASFLQVRINADIQVTDALGLYNQYRINLGRISEEIGSVLSTECFEEARTISRRFAPQQYTALEEELTFQLPSRLKQQSSRQDIFSNIRIAGIHVHVSLTEEYEEILQKATFADYENSARRSTLMSDMENMRVISQVMNSGADADVWLEVAQGRLTPTQAVDKINERKQSLRDKEIEQIEKVNQQGVMSDKDVRDFMKDVLSNAVDRGGSQARRTLLEGSGTPHTSVPNAADIPDLEDSE